MNKKVLGLLVVVLVGSQSIQALTKKQVAVRATIVGLTAGTGAYWLASDVFHGETVYPSGPGEETAGSVVVGDDSSRTPFLAGLGTFAGTTWVFGSIFSRWTASSRYRWALKQLAELEGQLLYRVQMNDANISRILQDSGCEYKDLPLIEAFEQLCSYDEKLRNIESELVKAVEDTGGSTKLGKKLKKLLRRLPHNLNHVRANETFIKNHDKTAWLEQWKVHQKRELERERMQRQALAYAAPQIHSHVVYHW